MQALIEQSWNSILHAFDATAYDTGNINIWEWWSGVSLYGVIRSHQATGDERLLTFLETWFDKNVSNRLKGSVNRVIPACVAMYLYEVHQKGCHRAVCEEYADWCLNGAILTSNGGMAHVWGPGVDGVELGAAEFRHQLWIDTIMMACVFMYQYGTASKNAALVRQAEKQMEIHLDSLFDKQAGLCYHAYDCRTQRKLGCFWGRGNGWIVTAMAEFFRLGCKNPALVGAFQTIMEHAYACRMENGFLHTLINDKDSYMESTGSMLFGYAAAVGCKMGVLPAVSGDWALQIAAGLEFHQNGCVKYASGGTDPSAAEVYKNIPYVETVYSFGIVMALAAGLLENGMK